MHLLEPLRLAHATAPNRVMFGPHVTNLSDDERRFTERHVAYYARRAGGGAGIYLGCMDALYDVEHGIWGRGAGGAIELVIVIVTFAFSISLLRWGWRRRHTLLALDR